MDQIEKALRKLTSRERSQIERILDLISRGQFESLDVKKLTGKASIFRVRKGELRIMFTKEKNSIRILTVERRSTTTYRKR